MNMCEPSQLLCAVYCIYVLYILVHCAELKLGQVTFCLGHPGLTHFKIYLGLTGSHVK